MIVGAAATFVAADATEKDAVVVVDADGTTFAAAAAAARAAVCTLILRNIFFFFFFFSRVNSEDEREKTLDRISSLLLFSPPKFFFFFFFFFVQKGRTLNPINNTLSQMFLCCLGSIFYRNFFFCFFEAKAERVLEGDKERRGRKKRRKDDARVKRE